MIYSLGFVGVVFLMPLAQNLGLGLLSQNAAQGWALQTTLNSAYPLFRVLAAWSGVPMGAEPRVQGFLGWLLAWSFGMMRKLKEALSHILLEQGDAHKFW